MIENTVYDTFVLSDVSTNTETLAAGQNIAARTPLGRVSATGLLVACDLAANDGSEVPVGLSVFDIDATSGAMDCPIYVSGRFDYNLVEFDASFDTDAKKKAAFDRTAITLIPVD